MNYFMQMYNLFNYLFDFLYIINFHVKKGYLVMSVNVNDTARMCGKNDKVSFNCSVIMQYFLSITSPHSFFHVIKVLEKFNPIGFAKVSMVSQRDGFFV